MVSRDTDIRNTYFIACSSPNLNGMIKCKINNKNSFAIAWYFTLKHYVAIWIDWSLPFQQRHCQVISDFNLFFKRRFAQFTSQVVPIITLNAQMVRLDAFSVYPALETFEMDVFAAAVAFAGFDKGIFCRLVIVQTNSTCS